MGQKGAEQEEEEACQTEPTRKHVVAIGMAGGASASHSSGEAPSHHDRYTTQNTAIAREAPNSDTAANIHSLRV